MNVHLEQRIKKLRICYFPLFQIVLESKLYTKMHFSFDDLSTIRFKMNSNKQNRRSGSLHKAVLHYKTLNAQLGYKLFESTKKSKKETKMLFDMRVCESQHESHSQYEMLYKNRRKRRDTLGIQQADIENHWNKLLGRPETALKRKQMSFHKDKEFQVSQYVKQKVNVKGFAARISHNLGKRKLGVKGLTKMINIQLIQK